MTPPSTQALDAVPEAPPDHLQLPDKDGTFQENFQEQPQSTLLTGSLWPRLQQLHPDDQYCIGRDSGIYWKCTTPPLNGCKAPDWFYVPGVPPMLDGQFRRSYVLWKEGVRPLLIIEYVSGDGSEERDTTPHTGKFWVYEQGIGAPYYAIFEGAKSSVELFRLVEGHYAPVPPNAAGRLPVPPLRIELGIWHGTYQGMDLPWLRVWDSQTGEMLPSTEEREQIYKQRGDAAIQRAAKVKSQIEVFRQELEAKRARTEEERKRALAAEEKLRRLADKLRALGIDPDAA